VAVSFIGGGTRRKHRPVASLCQTKSHNVVSSTPHLSGIRAHNLSLGYFWEKKKTTINCLVYMLW